MARMLATSLDYMRDHYVRDDGFLLLLKRFIEDFEHQKSKDVSMTCLDIATTLKNLGWNYNLEEGIDIYEVDLLINRPETPDKKFVVEVQGYTHYFRNVELLKGNNILKTKLLALHGYP